MKLLQVNYRSATPTDGAASSADTIRDAEQLAAVPGLHWKIWIHDEEGEIAGGIYLFATEEDAIAYRDALPAALGGQDAVVAFSAHLFDVDVRLTAMTGGPLPEVAVAA
jgi:hypothetical protein